jgi:hypothetical protein
MEITSKIVDRIAEMEAVANGTTVKWQSLRVLSLLLESADDENDNSVYRDDRGLVICNIPSYALAEGTSYSTEGMRSYLLGMAARFTDDDGRRLINVLVTHDLNSATIPDIGELIYAIRS